MTGARQTFWAVLEAALRFLARAPLGVGQWLLTLADWCRERAR